MSNSRVAIYTTFEDGENSQTINIVSTNSTGSFRRDEFTITTVGQNSSYAANTPAYLIAETHAGRGCAYSIGTAFAGSTGGINMKASGIVVAVGFALANIGLAAVDQASTGRLIVTVG